MIVACLGLGDRSPHSKFKILLEAEKYFGFSSFQYSLARHLGHNCVGGWNL